MAPTPEQIARARTALLEGKPEIAEALNELFWQEVAARVAELPHDLRTQAENHLEMLVMLLRDDDECADS
ncbi:MAG: hypothetical protein ACYDB4_17755 [Candidatus Dormibacteraceae bacterium]